MKMRSWVLWVASGGQGGSRSEKGHRIKLKIATFWPLGCVFGAIWEPSGSQRGPQNPPLGHQVDLRGSKGRSVEALEAQKVVLGEVRKRSQNGSEKVSKKERFWEVKTAIW